MIINLDQIKLMKIRNERVKNLKNKIMVLDDYIDCLEESEESYAQLFLNYNINVINNNIKSFNIAGCSKRELALDVLQCAKNNNLLLSYKDTLIISEYLLVGNKKIIRKSLNQFIKLKKRITKNHLENK